MTVNQIIKRLSKNSVDFLLAGEREKSNACMELLAMIKEKEFENIRGKLVDNL
jgi:hypothetical protein